MGMEIRGLDELFAKLDQIPGALEAAATDGVNKTLLDIQKDASKNALGGKQSTGHLAATIENYTEKHLAKGTQGGAISGTAGTDCEYAVPVEFGTGPIGQNTPVPDKSPNDVAHRQTGWTYYSEKGFINAEGKEQHFVHTNGQPARPYLYPAYQVHEGDLPENIKESAEKRLKEVADG